MPVFASLLAVIRLAAPFTDGVVLQRDMKVPVWGTAEPREKVSVSFGGASRAAEADERGHWRVDLPPMPACKTPRTLVATSPTSKASVVDILVGEVWICSGQSNMDVPLCGTNPRYSDRDGGLVAQMVDRPHVRFRNQYAGRWRAMNRESLFEDELSFSAIGSYFALELAAALDVPVGVVGAYVGGSEIARWTPDDADAHLWRKFVAPLAPFAVRGFIWYQGEADVKETPNRGYAAAMHRLYDGWAKAFENPVLKLRFVQIAPFDYSLLKERKSLDFVTVQLEQAKFAREEQQAKMAVICDVGNPDDIHPVEKQVVARRLAALALRHDYGFSKLAADAPTLKGWTIEDGAFVLTFDHARRWSIVNPKFTEEVGFEVAGEDGAWHPAAVVNTIPSDPPWRCGQVGENRLVVRSSAVAQPKALRYLFSKPWYGALHNEACLPLGPFACGDVPDAEDK